jgi:hypothetical protein
LRSVGVIARWRLYRRRPEAPQPESRVLDGCPAGLIQASEPADIKTDMSAGGSLFVLRGSRMTGFAETLAWLWRLGPLREEPDREAVGIGWVEEWRELDALLRARRLAGAVVFASRPGPDVGPIPPRHRVRGVADFGRGERVAGQFSLLDGGTAAVRSSLGAHAVREDRWMVMATDPEASWGALDGYWVLPALAELLVDVLDRPLVLLPPVGWIRYDDMLGNGYQQLVGVAKSDRRIRRRIESLAARCERVGVKVNLALSSRAWEDGHEVPVDELWPEATEAVATGIAAGVYEPVCHGYLHVDTEALQAGRHESREYAHLDLREAGRRVDVTLDWCSRALGAVPPTFVAPSWGYGQGLLAALAERELPAWLPPKPKPLLSGGNVHETLLSSLEGLHQFDFAPFARLAEAGLPPTIVTHGGLFDARLRALRPPRDLVPLMRLFVRRDLSRIPWTDGVRWIGAGDLVEHVRAHDEIEVRGAEVRLPEGAEAVAVDRTGRHPLRGRTTRRRLSERSPSRERVTSAA